MKNTRNLYVKKLCSGLGKCRTLSVVALRPFALFCQHNLRVLFMTICLVTTESVSAILLSNNDFYFSVVKIPQCGGSTFDVYINGSEARYDVQDNGVVSVSWGRTSIKTNEYVSFVIGLKSSITDVKIPEAIEYYEPVADTDGKIVGYDTHVCKVVAICDHAFEGYEESIISVEIPNSIEVIGVAQPFIGGGAFENCSNIKKAVIPCCDSRYSYKLKKLFPHAYDKIEEIVILEGVKDLSGIFDGCCSLRSVHIPSSVEEFGIDGYDFCDCNTLTSITIATDNPYYKSVGGSIFSKDGVALLVARDENAIPDSVVEIGRDAFRGRRDLAYIEIPNSITNIESGAFYESGLKSVVIPNSVLSVGSSAFELCENLKTVVLPGSIASIADSLFLCCTSLESVVVPNSVTSIGGNAFDGCKALKKVDISGSVEYILYSAFWGCESLESITIPSSVTFISARAFENCYNLTNVTFCGNAPFADSSSFSSVNRECKAYVKRDATGFPAEGERWYGLSVAYQSELSVCQVTLNNNALDMEDVFGIKSLKKGDAIGALPTPTRDGYIFTGWWTTADGGTEVTTETVVAADMTIYAHWTENPPPTPTYTATTPVPVRHDWLEQYPAILNVAGGNYEAAAMRPTGKKDGKGNALSVWHDYVAGTDPTNANSRFMAKVQFDGGVPKIGWEPDLNENGTKSERFYKVFGKKTLAANENWTRIADETSQKDYSFFKVTVNMEETPDTEEDLKFGDGSGTGGGTDGGGTNVDDNGDERPITLGSPYNFSAAGTGYGYIQLRWRSDMSYSSDSSKWVDFCVYRANVNDITMATKVATMSMHATYIPKEYEDRVDGFDTYYYWIRTETGTARSEWSAVASAALYLSGPKNLTATCDRYEGVMLEWDALSEATSYKVYADDEGGWSYNFTREVGETTGNSILDDDAPIGTKVRYKVLVVSPYAYEYSYSTVLGARYSGEQTAPDIAGSGNTEGIGISWQPVIGAVAYDIYRNTRNESSSATKIGTLASSGLNNGNSIGYTDKTADIGTTYYYWVKAVYASNESGFSQVFSAAKFAPHPTNVKATSLRSDGILLTWEPAAGATSYRIYSGSVMLTETTACRWLDTSIAQGSSRTYTKVTSVCAAGEYEIGGYVYLTGYRTSSDTIASVTMTGKSEVDLASNNRLSLLCTITMASGEKLTAYPETWDFSDFPDGMYTYECPNEYLYLTIDKSCFAGKGERSATIRATWTSTERDCDPTVYELSHTVVIHPIE